MKRDEMNTEVYICTYMVPHVFIPLCCSFHWLKLRMSALATVGTGTSLALAWKLLEGAALSGPPALLCPHRNWWDLHWPSLVLGLLCGLLLGPVLEGLVALRWILYQAAFRRVFGEPQPRRPLYRLL